MGLSPMLAHLSSTRLSGMDLEVFHLLAQFENEKSYLSSYL